MRIKEIINSAGRIASPEFASRAVHSNTSYEEPSDAPLVRRFLGNKHVRLPFVVGLYADREKSLSQKERVGLLYFNALVTRADEAIDKSPEFAPPLGRTELAIRLMAQPVWDTGLTIAGLARQTLDHFPTEKRGVITGFLDTMADIHTDRGRKSLGEYSYDEVRQYRDATDHAWVEATVKLIDSSADLQRIEKYQKFASLSQHVDDVWDLFEDAENGSQNLFLGLAADMSPRHPEEFEALQRYIDTPKDARPQQRIKNWLRENMPHTRAAYADKYRDILIQTHGLTKTIFSTAAKTI